MQAARVAGVAVVLLVGELAGTEVELGGVHDDHVIAGVDMGRVDRLVLAPEEAGGLRGDAPEHEAIGIDDVPRALDVVGLGAECAQRIRQFFLRQFFLRQFLLESGARAFACRARQGFRRGETI